MFRIRQISQTAGIGLVILGLIAGGPPSDAEMKMSAEQLVKVKLHHSVKAIHPGGPFLVGVEFEIHEHWHIYWKNSGESGMPTEVSIDAPDGFVIGDTLYPRPQRYRDADGMTYGYEDKVVLFIPITAPETISESFVTLTIDVDWLVCRRICKIGHVRQTLTLPVHQEDSTPPTQKSTFFEPERGSLPQSLDLREKAETILQDGRLTITGPAEGFTRFDFFPLTHPGVEYGPAEITHDDSSFHINVPVTLHPDRALGKPLIVEGLVTLGSQRDDPSYHFRLPPVDL